MTVPSNTPAPDVEPRLWTIPQAGRALSISPRSIYRLVGLGQLDVRKIGRSTRVVAASVDRFVKDGAAR